MSVLPLSVLNTAYIALGIFVETKYCTTDIRIFFFFFDSKERVEERPRPITVSDLEARPGSPSIVVVPGSRSSEEELSPKPGSGTGSW